MHPLHNRFVLKKNLTQINLIQNEKVEFKNENNYLYSQSICGFSNLNRIGIRFTKKRSEKDYRDLIKIGVLFKDFVNNDQKPDYNNKRENTKK